jgi:murein DD-endopeptidase MepM/ murein hydrolase activator NlpD
MTENLSADAERLASTFEKINRTLTQMNRSLKDFGTNLKRANGVGGSGGTGGTGSANGVDLGTDNAIFSAGGGTLQKLGTAGKVVAAIAGGIQTALPNMGSTLDRANAYYTSAIQSGVGNRKLMAQTTLKTMGNGLTSVGSDARASQILTQSGIMFSTATNSHYMQNIRNVSNTAQLYGIDNESAAASLANLTSGPTSGMLMATQGIQTSEAGTGKQLTEQQIFEQFYQRSTAGRGKATVEETMDSLHRGFLGQTIANSGLDEVGQKKLAQYFISKAGGKTVDLSDDTSTQKLLDENAKNGNANPMRGVYKQNQVDTRQMGKSEEGFIAGLETAVNVLESFNDVVGDVVSRFAGISGAIQTAGNMSAVRGTVQAVQGVAEAIGGGGGSPIGMQSSSLRGGGSGSFSSFGTGGGGDSGASVSTTSSGSSATTNGKLRMVHPVPGAGKGTRWNVKDKDHPNGHNGIDYKVKPGTAVRAAADGTVIVAGGDGANTYKSGKNTLGIQVQINHGNGVVSIYGHLSSTSVGLGPVKQGAIIGLSGNSGFSSGPHLHFQVNENGKDVNPEKYLGASNSDVSSTSGTNDSGATSTSTNPLSTSTPSGVVSAGVSGVSTSSSSVVDSLNGYSAPSSPFASGGGDPAGVSRTAGNISGYTGSSGYNEAGMSGNPFGSKYKNNVTINLTIAQASESEAHAFANRVKKILEQDTLMTNMGRL